MKYALLAGSFLLSLSVAFGNSVPEPASFSPHQKIDTKARLQHNLSIRVADGDWGDVKPEEIESVLNAVATDMLAHFP